MIQKLKECGLTEYEARAYDTLVSLGVSTATKVCAKSRVPHGKIYPTLFSLEQKGFIKVYPGTPKKFMAVEPNVALNKLILDKEKALKGLQNTTEKIIKSFRSRARHKEPLESVQMIEGFKHFLKVSIDLHDNTKTIWRSISVIPVYKPHLDAYRRLIKRGGEARVLTVVTDKNKENIKIWKDAGITIRALKEMPSAQFSLKDDEEAVIRITGGRKYLSIWIQNPSLAKSLVTYFDGLWKKAKPL